MPVGKRVGGPVEGRSRNQGLSGTRPRKKRISYSGATPPIEGRSRNQGLTGTRPRKKRTSHSGATPKDPPAETSAWRSGQAHFYYKGATLVSRDRLHLFRWNQRLPLFKTQRASGN